MIPLSLWRRPVSFRAALVVAGAVLVTAPAQLFAQPTAPTSSDVSTLRAQSQLTPRVAAAATPLAVNTNSREEVRQFYRTIYAASENVPLNWTGNYTSADPVAAAGATSQAFKDAVILRINFFRALAGVSGSVALNTTYSAKDQQAALMMSANNALQHTGIPTSWKYYTAAGSEAAASSNLSLGLNGPAAVTSLIQDSDGSGSLISVGANARAGHRRWFLYPQTREMGTGDVPGDGVTYQPAHATWIVDAQFGQTRPATREAFVAYPAPGYAPYPLVFPRWSFAYANADFAAATVTMTRGGASIPVRLEAPAGGSGENTLVWVYNDLSTAESNGHPRPSSDTTYGVTVSGVKVGSTTLPPFSYNVTVFDPDVAGPDASATTLSATTSPTAGVATAFTVAKPAYATGFEWRTLSLASYGKTYTAEAGLDGLLATTTPDVPAVVQSTFTGAGSASYRLSHASPRSSQLLTLPDTFLVGGSGSLSFLSRLGIATSIQTARVQVSTDDGASWSDVYAQAGTSPTGTTTPANTDNAFATRTVSLASYAGRTLRLRFAYTVDLSGVAYTADPSNTVGWFIDNVALTGVQVASANVPVSVASGSTFSYTPSAVGAFVLQARPVLFGAYPLEWGPAARLTAFTAGDPAQPARLINLSVLTDIATPGDKFTLGYVVGGAGTSGGKPLVIRAAGPSLGAFGVAGTLDDPKFATFAGSTSTGVNDNWGGSGTISDAMAAVGAFAYASPSSKDAAIATSISSRDNSVEVSSANNGTGKVIAEVYDATPTAAYTLTTPRLINVSVLKHLGNGLTVGFVVGGTGSKNILIRAIGPQLADFGVGGTVADPQLVLFNGASVQIGENDNWGGTAALTTAFTNVGAFGLNSASKDAALLVGLAPGAYSVQVSGTGGTTGVALVEVYEVP
jgi:uncharacterized protein YkwD